MNYSVTQYGKPLDKSKYVIDENNKIFSSKEDGLVLDFTGLNGWTFKTGYNCTFKTDKDCVFITGSFCNFTTGPRCTFDTLWNCVFNTGECCIFNVDYACSFNTLWDCTFDTSSNCTFNTRSNCIFKANVGCTFNTGDNCSFSIFNDFKKIETKGNSNVLIWSRGIHDYLKEKIEIYFDEENNEILYTENKLTKDKYKMMKELRK